MVIYDGTPQRKESSIPLFDLTKETSLPEEVTIDDDDEAENNFSLRLDSQNEHSQNEEKDVASQGIDKLLFLLKRYVKFLYTEFLFLSLWSLSCTLQQQLCSTTMMMVERHLENNFFSLLRP